LVELVYLYDVGRRRRQWMPLRPPLLPADMPNLRIHRGKSKLANFSFTLLNALKSFIGGLGQYMHKAAHHLGSMDSLNPHRWRGKWLHHHAGGVCYLFVCFALSRDS
jgi:hypothetical protein